MLDFPSTHKLQRRDAPFQRSIASFTLAGRSLGDDL
jgi:hypothetical protein